MNSTDENSLFIDNASGHIFRPEASPFNPREVKLTPSQIMKIQVCMRAKLARMQSQPVRLTLPAGRQSVGSAAPSGSQPQVEPINVASVEHEVITAPISDQEKQGASNRSPGEMPHPPPETKLECAPLVKSILKELGPFTPIAEDDGVRIEKRGPTTLDNGAVYEGEWSISDNCRHGVGTLIFPDGALFEGTWIGGKVNGEGRHIHSNGEYYIGSWKNDAVHGQGTLVHTDGASYSGMWENDKQNGKGVEMWPDGAKFKGHFVQGLKTGMGKFNWADGSYYKGNFKENSIEGEGLYYWSDGRQYFGTWLNNKMDGSGKFTWPDGRIYEGEYLEDKKHGQGTFIWPDGKKYVGSWKDGRQDGIGFFTPPRESSNTQPRKGEWKDGRRVRWVNDEA